MSHELAFELGRLRFEHRGAHLAFRGVPFAAPPLGALRFCAPEPASPWTGVRDATRFSAMAPQGRQFAPGVGASGPESEDCLTLNVYTPRCDGRKRPVMFFIHGGAFTMMHAFASFAHAGAPTLPDATPWPRYAEHAREMLIFDRELRASREPFAEERRAWDGV